MSLTNSTGKWYDSTLAREITSKKYFHDGEDFDGFVKRVSGIFDTDIVVVGRPYCNFIFAVTEKAFENIKKTVGV